jgi:hypothetical protein
MVPDSPGHIGHTRPCPFAPVFRPPKLGGYAHSVRAAWQFFHTFRKRVGAKSPGDRRYRRSDCLVRTAGALGSVAHRHVAAASLKASAIVGRNAEMLREGASHLRSGCAA